MEMLQLPVWVVFVAKGLTQNSLTQWALWPVCSLAGGAVLDTVGHTAVEAHAAAAKDQGSWFGAIVGFFIGKINFYLFKIKLIKLI